MTDWLDQLLVALREARVEVSAEDVLDVVWLAPLLDAPPSEPEVQDERLEEPLEAKKNPRPQLDEPEPAQEPEPTPKPPQERPRPSGPGRGELHLPGPQEPARTGGGRPLRAPTGSALPGSLALSRALRPLRRRVPSRIRRVLDVNETVRRVAEEGLWLPALRPARDRWLELSMVVDAGSSMGPWRSLATELLKVFSSLGAFRSVRLWSLETEASPIRLRAGLFRPGAARRDPRELVDPAGRSLIVILTDCVADSWSDGRVASLIEEWSRSGPCALLQVLPENLWNRSALGLASYVRLTPPGPAAANSRLHSRSTELFDEALISEGLPFPVASLTPEGLSAWARVVAGAVGADVPGYRLDLAPLPMPSMNFADTAPPPTPRERLDRFWKTASPPARRLAGLLAASPALTLPVIRLVRQALMPEARQVHEAEVLLGDLLRIVDLDDTSLNPDIVRYEFHDGLRPILLDAVPSVDALDVLSEVSSYVEQNLAIGQDFQAMLADPSSSAGSVVPEAGPFAKIAADVLLRLGGDYSRLVKTLPATVTCESNPTDQIRSVRIWDVLTGAEIARLEGHVAWVTSVAFSPDGRRIVSGSSDKTIRVWDAKTRAEIARIEGHEGGVNCVAFSPDGRRIVSGSSDKTIRVWDATTRAEIARLDWHNGGVNSVAYSPDGERIVSGSSDKTLRLWDAETGALLGRLKGHERGIRSVAFSPDGERIVSGSSDKTLRLWDAETGAQLASLEGHEGGVNSTAFSPDGRWIVSGSSDGSIRLWDAENWAELTRIDGHEGHVNSVTFSPDGHRLVSGSDDGTMRVWNAAKWVQIVQLHGHEAWVTSVVFSPDGQLIVSGSGHPDSVAQPAGTVTVPTSEDLTPSPEASTLAESTLRQRIDQVRSSHVRITYDVESAGAIETRELPFVIGVMADLSGQSVQTSQRIFRSSARRFVEIDRDNFHDVMMQISPQIEIQIRDTRYTSNTDSEKQKNIKSFLSVSLQFDRMEDFKPESIVRQIPELDYIQYTKSVWEIDPPEHQKHAVQEYVRSVWINQIREIIHHPDFKRLEAAWRGLHYLVENSETGKNLKIKILNVGKRELLGEQVRSTSYDQHALFALVNESQFGVSGGEPFGLLIGDYEFDQSAADGWLLDGISSVAAAAHAPFVGSASPAFFNIPGFADLSKLRWLEKLGSLREYFKGQDFAAWRSFRESDASRFVGLTLPRILGRLPYGATTHPIEGFPFEEWEEPPPHDGYLWLNAAWAFAACVAESMADRGWPAAIWGTDTGDVRTFPTHHVHDEGRALRSVGPVEVELSDREDLELSKAGFIPLAPTKGYDSSLFLSIPSCRLAKSDAQPESTLSAQKALQINVTLCSSRFVHSLKILCRANKKLFDYTDELEAYLNSWLGNYVGQDKVGGISADRPLAEGRVSVEHNPKKPGLFRVILSIKPAYQLDELPTALQEAFEIEVMGRGS